MIARHCQGRDGDLSLTAEERQALSATSRREKQSDEDEDDGDKEEDDEDEGSDEEMPVSGQTAVSSRSGGGDVMYRVASQSQKPPREYAWSDEDE